MIRSASLFSKARSAGNWIGIALSALACTACGPAGSEQSATQIGVSIAGPLDKAMVERLQSTDFSKASYVRLYSPGSGDNVSAIAVARLLKRQGKPIFISGYCGTACLMIALISKPKVQLDGGSLFTVGNTATSSYYMSRDKYPDFAERVFKPRMQTELNWIAENRVDPRVLLLPQIMIDTKCLTQPIMNPPDGIPTNSFGSKYLEWVIPKEDLRRFHISTDMAEYANSDVVALTKEYFPNIPGASMRNEPIPLGELGLSFEQLAAQLSAVPVCTAELVNRNIG